LSTTRKTKDSLEFLHEEVKKKLGGIDDNRKYYRSNYYKYTLLSAEMSALTTFFIGINQIFNCRWIVVAALFTSASITVFAAWDAFFKNKEMWILNTDTLMQLRGLESKIRYMKAKGIENVKEKQVDKLFFQFETILQGQHVLWKTTRESKEIV